MKKIFNVFAVLLLTGMIAAGFVSCSNASGGGSGSGDGGKNVAAVYESHSDRVTVYDDFTWKSIYLQDGQCYNSGTWERKSGDFTNGEAIIHVTFSKSPYVSTGDYGVQINNGTFVFFFTPYHKK